MFMMLVMLDRIAVMLLVFCSIVVVLYRVVVMPGMIVGVFG